MFDNVKKIAEDTSEEIGYNSLNGYIIVGASEGQINRIVEQEKSFVPQNPNLTNFLGTSEIHLPIR